MDPTHRLTKTPVSTVEKRAMGALFVVRAALTLPMENGESAYEVTVVSVVQ